MKKLTKKQRAKTLLAVRFKNPTEVKLIKQTAKSDKLSVNSFCRVAILSQIDLTRSRT